jgi:ligand-binding SRPBCC domain-containing protein
MSTYRLKDEVLVNAPLEEVWDFFTDPRNLQKITPSDMGFRHKYEPDASKVYRGMILVYTVSPLLGIPLEWVTVISEVNPLVRFVDDQVRGPFALWHHIHEFESRGERTLVRDLLYYAMPFGPIGKAAHGLTVKKRTEKIFEYRRKALREIFPEENSTNK